MQSLESASEEGECELKKAKISYTGLPFPSCSQDSALPSTSAEAPQSYCADADDRLEEQLPTFDIFKKLEELCESSPELSFESEGQLISGVSYKSLILEELVQRERLNTLILNLYPGNKGYSFAFRSLSRTDPKYTIEDDTANTIEMRQWLYEQDDLLGYISNEELPPFLVDVLGREFSFLFYSGCVICEVRDYHKSYPNPKYHVQHVLLRPTHKSILADANNIIEERPELCADDRDHLESQLLLATAPDLCLDPDPTIEDRVAELHNESYTWNTRTFRRMAKKFSQVTVNRKRKLDQFTRRPGTELYDFENRLRGRRASTARRRTDSAKATARATARAEPAPSPPPLSPPRDGVHIKEFKTYQRPAETGDCLPQLIEEYVFETDMPSKGKGKPRVYHIKLSIFQRPSNSEYIGELYLDRDHKRNEQNGVACRFSLGSRANAHRYIHQFTEIFTESGRKSVRIRHDINPDLKWRVGQQNQVQQVPPSNPGIANLAKEHLNQLTQLHQKQSCSPAINGTVTPNSTIVSQKQATQQNVPILQSHLQNNAQKMHRSSQEMEINALATEFMNSAQQFQASANAKQQQQQHKYLAGESSNAAIINLLTKSSPLAAAVDNGQAGAESAVAAAPSPAPHTPPQRLVARKMTLAGLGGARVLQAAGVGASGGGGRSSLAEQLAQRQQPQTITLASVNSGGSYVNYAAKQQVVGQRLLNSANESKSLSALLVGTPAADRPDIVGPSAGSLLLEKLAGGGGGSQGFAQAPKSAAATATAQQFVVRSPKGVVSPLSSPPPHNAAAVNVQGLSFAQLQNLQNVQVQLPGFSQPISLSLNGNMHGHPASLLVSLPVTTATQTAATASQAAVASDTVEAQTVVLTSASTSNFAHLVSAGTKAQQRPSSSTTAVPQTVSITQGGHQFQIISQLQRPGRQQLAARALQSGAPITFKVAAAAAAASTANPPQLTDLPFNFDD